MKKCSGMGIGNGDALVESTPHISANMIENDMQKFLEAIEQFGEHMYEITEILIANPMDLIEINMYEIPPNCYFISDYRMDKGTMYKVEDGELKRMLYRFIEEFPDRVFRG